MISIIAPALNEQKNIKPLVQRVDNALKAAKIKYELVIVDDYSTDKTAAQVRKYSKKFPVRLHKKRGPQGKAYSLLEGFKKAKYDLVGMIDADLQYPPEAIPEMVRKIIQTPPLPSPQRGWKPPSLEGEETGGGLSSADIVVANRQVVKTSWRRKIASKTFKLLFGKLLHRLDVDVQSGLKIFRKEIIERVSLKPTPWTFDLEFLLQARDAGYKITGHDIEFSDREAGESKIKFIRSIKEIGWSSIKQKFKHTGIVPSHPNHPVAKGRGFHYKGSEFIHHTDLHHSQSAFKQFTLGQLVSIFSLLAILIIGLVLNWQITLITIVSLLSLFYFADLIFNSYLIYRSLSGENEIKISEGELESPVLRTSVTPGVAQWPSYTILCPLYKEWQVIPQFVEAMRELDYPHDKLQILLLLEEDDHQTIAKVKTFNLPDYFQTIIVPHSLPKTKPKACNYGLDFATGEYVVIYDAEDRPDPDQLKKAVLAFRRAPLNTLCVQAKLNYYNPNQNLLTRLFTAEYSLWFDLILPGLQSIKAPIPLGGTSNHFRTKELIKLQRWDAFNVTEDCDLGIRLAKKGYQTAIVDSTTWEEANSEPLNWYRQRTRWVKGYIQTYLVHMRRVTSKEALTSPEILSSVSTLSGISHGISVPDGKLGGSPVRNGKWTRLHNLFFQLTVGGKILSMIINPFMWATTAVYFTFRPIAGPFIESLYLGPVFYMAVFSAIFGNFIYLYFYMIGCARRGQFALIKYAYLVPFYWIGMSIAAWRSAYEVVINPHYWAKTKHGLHLKPDEFEEVHSAEQAILSHPLAAPAIAGLGAGDGGHKTDNKNRIFDKQSVKSKFLSPKIQSLFSGLSLSEGWRSVFGHLPSKNLKSLTKLGGPLVIASIISNFLNFFYHAYLGRVLPVDVYGTVSLIGSLLFLAQIPMHALSSTVTHQSGWLLGKLRTAPASFRESIRNTAFKFALAATGIWMIITPMLGNYFQLPDLLPLYLFTPVWIIGALFSVETGFISGSQLFTSLAAVIFSEAVSKIIFTWIFVYFALESWIYLAVPLSLSVGLLIGIFLIRRYLASQSFRAFRTGAFSFDTKFWGTSLLTNIASIAYLNLDVILAKHYLPPTLAGQYALLSLTGKMVFWAGSLFSQFIVPTVSKASGANVNHRSLFYKLLAAATVFNLGAYLIFGWFGQYTVPLLLGEQILPVIHLLPVYAAIGVFFAIAQNLISYHQIRHNYIFPVAGFLLASAQVIGLVFFHQSLEIVAYVMLFSGIVYLEGILALHLVYPKLNFNVSLKTLPNKPHPNLSLLREEVSSLLKKWRQGEISGKHHVLIYNWRDIKHVWSGGAEVYVHEIAKRMIEQGHQVTLFCGHDRQTPKNETIDGVRIIRRGGFYTVYLYAIWYYITRFWGKIDIIIDCENGIPFFTPLYVREPVLLLIHHIHQEVYFKHLKLAWYKLPAAVFANFLESKFMPFVYRRNQIITVSPSSKRDIVNITGFGNSQVNIIYGGVDLSKFSLQSKTAHPTYTFVGRLQAYKNVDTAIRAFHRVFQQLPEAKLEIVGSGECIHRLKNLAARLNISSAVTFHGKVSDNTRNQILASSWALLQPSSFEGWSLVINEANASGTAAIASNVNGLRDAVVDGETGLLVPLNDTRAWYRAMLQIALSPQLRNQLSANAYERVQQFTWESSTEKWLDLINNEINLINQPAALIEPALETVKNS